MDAEMNKSLELLAGTGKKVRIVRPFSHEPRLNGYLLAISAELLLMHCFDDFEPDGYTICRTRDVVTFRQGPYEDWFDGMLRSEGLLNGLMFDHKIDLSSMATAIESVAGYYQQMIVECEDAKEPIEDFYIGNLLGMRERSIRFRSFDALGYWSKQPHNIKLNEITKIQFDTPYIRLFSKYTRDGNPPEIPKDDT